MAASEEAKTLRSHGALRSSRTCGEVGDAIVDEAASVVKSDPGPTVIRASAERSALWPTAPRGAPGRGASSTPDSDAEGEPLVSNGVALCKLHHAAFDRFFFAIRPDYVIEVRPSLLQESDGPMLVVGLQRIHGQQIHLPRRPIDLPDPVRLERRYEQFRQAAG